ncbi:hypothetical protein ACFLZP_04085 [Patescibacteria group bacterium]
MNKTRLFSIGFIFLLLVATLPTTSAGGTRIRYVDPQGVDTGGCTNRQAPCRAPQYAVDQADDGDIVSLAPGIYTGLPQGQASMVIIRNKEITIRGAFSPVVPNDTVLDPQGQGRAIEVVNSEVVIEDLVIRNGQPQPQDRFFDSGGGIMISGGSSVKLGWVAVHDCSAGHGGGIFSLSSDLIVRYSPIFDNITEHFGGGIGSMGGNLVVEGSYVGFNAITGDQAFSGGGGIYAYTVPGKRVEFQDVEFSNNSAPAGVGGAAFLDLVESVAIEDCQFDDNTSDWGGALALSQSPTAVHGSSFFRNEARDEGGAIWYDQVVPVVVDSVFHDNAPGDYHPEPPPLLQTFLVTLERAPVCELRVPLSFVNGGTYRLEIVCTESVQDLAVFFGSDPGNHSRFTAASSGGRVSSSFRVDWGQTLGAHWADLFVDVQLEDCTPERFVIDGKATVKGVEHEFEAQAHVVCPPQ